MGKSLLAAAIMSLSVSAMATQPLMLASAEISNDKGELVSMEVTQATAEAAPEVASKVVVVEETAEETSRFEALKAWVSETAKRFGEKYDELMEEEEAVESSDEAVDEESTAPEEEASTEPTGDEEVATLLEYVDGPAVKT